METWKKYKMNWIPQITIVLLYLVLLSIWWISGLSARFVTGAAAEDNARVALFNVTNNTGNMSKTFAVVMKPGDGSTAPGTVTVSSPSAAGESNDITVKVKNSSETAVSYTIAFLLDGNLPITVTTADTGIAGTTANTGSTGTTVDTGAAGTAAAGGAAALTQEDGKPVWKTAAAMAGDETAYKFHLAWDTDKNGYQFSEGIESITVEITAVQED